MYAWLQLLRLRFLRHLRQDKAVFNDAKSLGLLSGFAALVAAGALSSLLYSIISQEPQTPDISRASAVPSVTETDPPGSDPLFGGEGLALAARAPVSPENLIHIDENASAYREGAAASLSDVTRQIDAAILQALARQGISSSQVSLAHVETRYTKKGESYPFLRVGILTGDPQFNSSTSARKKADINAFISVLRDSLKIWAPRARFRQEGDDLIFITVDKLVTHSLRYGTNLPDSMTVLRTREERESLPVLTIIIDDMGESLGAARKLIALPYPVTFSIWPQSEYATYTATLGAERGKQIFIHQPMEPLKATRKDILKSTLMVSASAEDISLAIDAALKAVPYAVGLNNHQGSGFTSNLPAVSAFLHELKAKRADLILVDSLTHRASLFYDEALRQGFCAYERALFLDDSKESKADVLRELDKALALARKYGDVVVIGHPRAGTLAALAAWKGYAAKDVRIAPLAR